MSTSVQRRRRSRRYLILAPLSAIGVALVAYWLGVSPRHAVLMCLGLVLVGVCAAMTGIPSWLRFPLLPYNRQDGARREVSNLTWSLYGDHGGLARPAVRRLHSAAMRAAHHAGIDLESTSGRARAQSALGTPLLAFLDDPFREPVGAAELSSYLSAIEKLTTKESVPT